MVRGWGVAGGSRAHLTVHCNIPPPGKLVRSKLVKVLKWIVNGSGFVEGKPIIVTNARNNTTTA